jgi:hypothetical protein
MQEAIDEMNLEKMLQAAENFEYNLQQFEQQLDRFMEMFELALAEQKLEELVATLKSLFENQENIKNDLIDKSYSDELIAAQERQNKKFEDFQSTIKESIENLDKFSKETSKSLEELLNSELNKETKKSLNDSKQKLYEKNQSTLESLSKASNNINSMLDKAKEIKESFQEESIQKMTQEFYRVINSILILSHNQFLSTSYLNYQQRHFMSPLV